MRNLTVKQKKLLKTWFDKNKEDLHGFDLVEDIPMDLYDELEQINDSEVLYQNINHYLCDLLHN